MKDRWDLDPICRMPVTVVKHIYIFCKLVEE